MERVYPMLRVAVLELAQNVFLVREKRTGLPYIQRTNQKVCRVKRHLFALRVYDIGFLQHQSCYVTLEETTMLYIINTVNPLKNADSMQTD